MCGTSLLYPVSRHSKEAATVRNYQDALRPAIERYGDIPATETLDYRLGGFSRLDADQRPAARREAGYWPISPGPLPAVLVCPKCETPYVTRSGARL
jgi:hypothetical protein